MSITTPLRTTLSGTRTIQPKTTFICSQCRHATLLRRPRRPYTFTQLITLSDGSTFTHRTTNPMPLYRATRDTRNVPLWNPSSPKLVNFELDEAGRLAAFRAKFGRMWDANTPEEKEGSKDANVASGAGGDAEQQSKEDVEEEDNLLDLISSFGQESPEQVGNDKQK
ncbi:hypothetical protein PHISCL_10288, partial [Aspergillus sclerotialis]